MAGSRELSQEAADAILERIKGLAPKVTGAAAVQTLAEAHALVANAEVIKYHSE